MIQQKFLHIALEWFQPSSERLEQASLNIGFTPLRKNNVFVVSLFARIIIRNDSPIPSPQ